MVRVFFMAILSLFLIIISCDREKPKKFEHAKKVTVLEDQYGKKYYTGLVIPKGFAPKTVRSALAEMKAKGLKLPATFDWRQKFRLSDIEDQGNCGSCWAFSTAATFQDVLILKGGRRDMSEQYLLSCTNPQEWNCRNGGFFAHDMHKKPKGAVNESEYPYTASDTMCKPGLKYNEALTSWAYVPGEENPDIEEVKAAIYMYGPVGCGVAADDTFSNYSGGVFQGSGSTDLNHAVNLVGWGNGYWIMRNSWGSQWGEQGYMRIKYGVNGIGAMTNYIVYGSKPQPDPQPDPTPDPTPDPDPQPDPTPDPTPDPEPEPDPDCDPQPIASTGFGPNLTIDIGKTITLGTDPMDGHTYKWSASPAFSGGAQPTTSRIRYFPTATKTITVKATTECGTASASTKITTRGVSLIDQEKIIPVK